MKIAAVIDLAQRRKLPPLQRKALEYMEARGDEVFGYRDEALIRDLGGNPAAVGFTLWALHEKGLIEKQKAGGKVYFGSKAAIEELRTRQGVATADVYEDARRNRERIRETIGNVDTLKILDEVREGN